MNKILTIAALALVLSACSNEDNDIQTSVEQPAKSESEGIPFTATISIGENAMTRTLTEDATNNQIVPTWVVGEKVVLIHNDVIDEMEVQSVSSNVATITGTITGSPANGDPVTIIYPSSAVDLTTKDIKANLLAAQDGTLTGTAGTSISEKYDVRKGTGTLHVGATASLYDNVSLTNQNAIFKFTLQDLSAAAKSATEFKVSDNSGNVITTVTPGSASGELYVALPEMVAGTYWFNATIDSKPYIAKATTAAATVAGKYYQTTVKMATIGDVILEDGTFAASSSTGTKVAVIVYLGSDTYDATFKNGLAIALADESGTMNWSTAMSTCGAKTAITGAKWCLPSLDQWKQMFKANGGSEGFYDVLNITIKTAGGTTLQENAYYWSSSELNPGYANRLKLDFGPAHWSSGEKNYEYRVRACLAF